MLTKRTLITILFLLAILLLVGYVTYVVSEQHKAQHSDAAQTLGTDATAQYRDLSGAPVSLDSFSGKVRVVNSWASWSPLSKTELQELDKLAAAYADRGVVVIAINRNEDPVRAQRFIDTVGPFTHITFVMDGDDTFYDRMDGKAMPETLFFDKDGTIVMHARGELSYDAMTSYVETALSAQ